MDNNNNTREVQMGGVALQPDPNSPPPRPHLPKPRDFGLEQLKPHMQEGAWETFITVVAWAIHWQDIVDGRNPKFDESKMGIFMSPFVGMGNPNVWPLYQTMVSTLFMERALSWFEEGESYQKNNSLVWMTVETLAKPLAQVSRGWQARQAVRDILAKRDELDVPFR